MNYNSIKFEEDDNIGIISLNRPERMNAVIEEMYLEIQDILDHLKQNDKIRCIVLTGSVLRKEGVEKQAFCAGADLKEHSSGQRSHAQKRKYIQLAHETTRMIYEFPFPVIAAVNGPARGAGAEMALSCDIIYIAENASIAFPEVGLGTFIGGGVTSILVKSIGIMRAKEMVYSGRVINGEEAVEIGLALKSLPVNRLMEEVKNYAHSLAEKAPISMKFAKKRLTGSSLLDIETVLQLETDAILTCMDTDDWHEGINSFTEKRKPVYKGR
ncbi:MAG: enoyl-CoA hydratase/isomerase family protein [Spirochaetota bacterium]|nr:enoyl-CoA hydratase/isomerase family protein [Spirochaetota bacterium]